MIIKLDDKLNKDQINAIIDDSSVLLIACPGSGKTRTLSYKVAYELERIDSKRKFIVAITYTNRAADEIRERLDRLGVDTNQLWIGTIHGFCLEWIVRPYHGYISELKNGFTVINSYDFESIISDICSSLYGKKINYYDCGFFVTPRGFMLSSLEIEKHDMIKSVLLKYFKTLKVNNQIDFEQILYYAYEILVKNPIISKNLMMIFPLILIDEYQDTKEIQYHIISKIVSAGKGDTRVFIVGDPNQSIYNTLGGFPMEKQELESLIGFKLKEYSLNKNYRSSQKVIDYYNEFKVYQSEIVAVGEESSYPSIITYNTDIDKNDLVDQLVKMINFNLEVETISENEICIVAPQWIHLGSITRQLTARLPHLNFDGPGMVPFSRDIENFWFKVSRLILTEPSPVLYTRRIRWANEILKDLDSFGYSNESLNAKKFLRIINSIKVTEEKGLQYLEKFFDKLCEELIINRSAFPTLDNHYNSFFESSTVRMKRLIIDGSPYMDDTTTFKKAFKPRSGITISSIHGTKGEEYDTVIAFALLDDYVPHFKDDNGEVNSKKLLYVLASRARKNLHLISESGWGKNYYHPEGKMPTPNLLLYSYDYDVI